MNASTTETSAETTLIPYDPNQNGYFVIPKETYDHILKVMLIGVLPPLVVFGLIGNIITLLVLRLQRPRTPTLYLQISLAVADTFFLLSTALFTTVKVISFYNKIKGANIANLLNPSFFAYFNQLPVRISHLIIAAIATERTIAVFLPLKSRQIWTKKVSILAISLGIFIPVFVTFPRLFQYKIVEVVDNATSVMMYKSIPTEFGKNKEFFGRLFIATIVCFNIIPVGIVFVCNTSIIFGLFKRKRNVLATFGSEHVSQLKEDDSITKTLLIISTVFFICLMPTAIHIIITSIDTEYIHPNYRDNLLVMLAYFAMLLDVFNSAVNCIIYVASSSLYRGRFKAFICCKEHQPKGNNHRATMNAVVSSPPIGRSGSGENNFMGIQDRGTVLFVYD